MEEPKEIIRFNYKFKFDNGQEKQFELKLDGDDLHLIIDKKDIYPEWTELLNFKCPNCQLYEN